MKTGDWVKRNAELISQLREVVREMKKESLKK